MEKMELERAIVLRRVVDIEALLAEQTRVPKASDPRPNSLPGVGTPVSAHPSEPGEATVGEQPPSPSEPVEAVAPEPTPTPSQERAEADPSAATAVESSGVLPAPILPAPSPPPQLVIPPFAAGAMEVAFTESTQPGGTVVHEEEIDAAWLGKRLEYAIVYENRKRRRSPPSAIAQIEPLPPLAPPSEIDVSSGDGFVNVRWKRAVALDESTGFAVFRRGEADADYPEQPLNAVPLREAQLVDRTAVFGTALCYIVRTVFVPVELPTESTEVDQREPREEAAASSQDEELDSSSEPQSTVVGDSAPAPDSVGTSGGAGQDPLGPVVPVVPRLRNPVSIRSIPSPESCLTPEDRFAPPAPTDIVAVPAADGILLTWRIVEAHDLAGYKVYRAPSREGPFELLGESAMGSFSDTEAEPGKTFYYAVTAVDDAPAANESPRSELAAASRPPVP